MCFLHDQGVFCGMAVIWQTFIVPFQNLKKKHDQFSFKLDNHNAESFVTHICQYENIPVPQYSDINFVEIF